MLRKLIYFFGAAVAALALLLAKDRMVAARVLAPMLALFYLGLLWELRRRERAEESLRAGRRLLLDVIDGSPSIIFLKDLEGRFITINKRLEELLGFSREQLRGKTDYDLFPKERADYYREHDREVVATGRGMQLEETAELKDGRHVFLASKFPLIDEKGRIYGVGAISHDVTEVRLAQEVLRRSKEDLERLVAQRTAELREAYEALSKRERESKSLLEHLPDYIVRVDRELRYVYVSPTITALTGVPAEGYIGKPRSAIEMQAEYKEKADALLNRVLETRKEARGEVVFRTAAGLRYFDAIVVPELGPDGSIESVLGVSRDVTEVKQAEKRAALLQDVARTIAEARDYPSALEGILRTICQAMDWSMGEIWVPTPDGKALQYGAVWSCDPERFRRFIEAGRTVSRGPGDGLPGKAWQKRGPVWMDEIVPGPGFPRAEVALRVGQRSAFAVPVFAGEELVLVMAFGKLVTHAWKNDPMVGVIEAAARQIGGYILRKRAEDERERLRREFLEAQKLEAVGRLAGGVAHDFANILSAVLGTSELVLSALDRGDPRRGDLELIRDSSLHGVALIRQLLAIGRGRMPQAGSWDLNQVLSGMEQLLKRTLGEDIRLELRLGRGLWDVHSDKGHLEQVVMNLAVNARDAMPQGGLLRIETENRMLGSKALGLGLLPGEYVRLAVRDTGVGMPDSVKARIFEPFYTTKPPGTGTGLGLATVQHIVGLSGGRVEVESGPGKGTTFTLYFPRAEAKREEKARPSAPPVGRDWKHGAETVLLVEDDDVVRSIAGQVLKRAGYAVLEARSAEEALRVVKEKGSGIQLLITDVQLPGADGFALAREFERLCPHVPVACISGLASDELKAEARAAERAPVIISKPFTIESLLRKVRLALSRPVGAGR